MTIQMARREPFKVILTDWLYDHKLLTAVLILAVILGLLLWPVHLISDIDPEDVECVNLFDGNTGAQTKITGTEEIGRIVTELRQVPMRRCLNPGQLIPRDGIGLVVSIKMEGSGKVHKVQFCPDNDAKLNGFPFHSYGSELPYDYIKSLCPKDA